MSDVACRVSVFSDGAQCVGDKFGERGFPVRAGNRNQLPTPEQSREIEFSQAHRTRHPRAGEPWMLRSEAWREHNEFMLLRCRNGEFPSLCCLEVIGFCVRTQGGEQGTHS